MFTVCAHMGDPDPDLYLGTVSELGFKNEFLYMIPAFRQHLCLNSGIFKEINASG